MPSSVIKSSFYNDEHETLTIIFRSGEVYIYYKVPPAIYTAFKAARSKGRFFNKAVARHFRFRRLQQGC